MKKMLPKQSGGVPMKPGLHAHVVYPRVSFEQVAFEPQSESTLQALRSFFIHE
jgi:hypothetical protein